MLQPTIPAPPVLDPVRPKPVPAAAAVKASLASVELVIDVVEVASLDCPTVTGSPSLAMAVSGNAADAASAAAPPAAAARRALRERGAEALSVMVSLSRSRASDRGRGTTDTRRPTSAARLRIHAGTDGLSPCGEAPSTVTGRPVTPDGRSCHGGRAQAMAHAQNPAGDEPPLALGMHEPTRADA